MPVKPTIIARDENQLRELIALEIEKQGPQAMLNHIDVSGVQNMDGLFKNSPFNGDISKWDTSAVLSAESLFEGSAFNGDISQWDTSYMYRMSKMFKDSAFNGDISKWNVAQTEKMDFMFENCPFNGDLSKWDVSNVGQMDRMFKNSLFNGDLSKWNVHKLSTAFSMFENSAFNGDIGKWTFKKLIGCSRMFAGSVFNQDISQWVLPSTFGNPRTIVYYDARMCGVTTTAQSKPFVNSAEYQAICRERKDWINENKDHCNANAMFANAAFKRDISSWDLLNTPNAGMFDANDAGLAAQTLCPWLLRYLLDEDKPLPDPRLEQLWAPARPIMSALLPSTQEQAQEAFRMLQSELDKSMSESALEITNFDGFLAT